MKSYVMSLLFSICLYNQISDINKIKAWVWSVKFSVIHIVHLSYVWEFNLHLIFVILNTKCWMVRKYFFLMSGFILQFNVQFFSLYDAQQGNTCALILFLLDKGPN